MNTPLDITIVLPIKSAVSRDFEDYFEKAITSIKNQKVSVKELLIVTTTEEKLNNHVDGFDFGEINMRKIVWDKEATFASQVNFGIENATTKWVSFFEFDDEYSTIWFDNVRKYMGY